METETNGWGESTVATAYVYERVRAILETSNPLDDEDDAVYYLSRFLDELAHNYKVDTGRLIAEVTNDQ